MSKAHPPFEKRLGAPLTIIVMGVSGSGKSTLGARLSDALDCPFLEGDEYHDAAAIAKMRRGEALTDEDRWPWLDRLGKALATAAHEHGRVVAACSALRRVYRERLKTAVGGAIRFVLLDNGRDELAGRLAGRPDHYMPVSLIDTQLATLERPGADEPAITLNSNQPVDRLIAEAKAWLEVAGQCCDVAALPDGHDGASSS